MEFPLCRQIFLSFVFIFLLYPFSGFSFCPPHHYPQTDPPLLVSYFQFQTPFNPASVISRNPDIIGHLDARTTLSFRGTKLWGDRSRFHPGCQVEDSELFGKELLDEIGGGSTNKPSGGREIVSEGGGCFSVGIGIHQFGLACILLGCFMGYLVWAPCICALFVPLVGDFVPHVGDLCIAGLVASCQ